MGTGGIFLVNQVLESHRKARNVLNFIAKAVTRNLADVRNSLKLQSRVKGLDFCHSFVKFFRPDFLHLCRKNFR